MKRFAFGITAIAAVATLGGVAVAATQQFRAEPIGANERPVPVVSDASARFSLKLSDRDTARFDLKIDDPLVDLTQAHLHLGPDDGTGPVVVWLYPADTRTPTLIPGAFEGRLGKGEFDVDDLVGPLADADWDTFVDAVEDGRIYVNVHTSSHPAGEIRDQVHQH